MLNPHKKKRVIFIASIFAVSVLALVFTLSNFRDNIVFFYSPSELYDVKNLKKVEGKAIRVGGLVVEGSVKRIDSLTVEFAVTDMKQSLRIRYVGILPDLFREKQGVIAKGVYDEVQDKFFSKELLVKHDEKYMPPEVAKSLKK